MFLRGCSQRPWHSMRQALPSSVLGQVAYEDPRDLCVSRLKLTANSPDPIYNKPFVDVNELRIEPVPHRYVHGVFKNTGAEFSFYFPPAEQYQGRFSHNTYPLATTSDIGPFLIEFDISTGNLAFTVDSSAYYVQTNLCSADSTRFNDSSIGAFRVNAEAAKFSRVIASELYGDHRPYGYIFGRSGGAYQVYLLCFLHL
ncbi:hypothetical protein ACJ41O_000016 [Fusarium nematophilum]